MEANITEVVEALSSHTRVAGNVTSSGDFENSCGVGGVAPAGGGAPITEASRPEDVQKPNDKEPFTKGMFIENQTLLVSRYEQEFVWAVQTRERYDWTRHGSGPASFNACQRLCHPATLRERQHAYAAHALAIILVMK